MGWGAEDMKATCQQQLAMGTKFFEPLSDISDIGGKAGTKIKSAFIEGPDRISIEVVEGQAMKEQYIAFKKKKFVVPALAGRFGVVTLYEQNIILNAIGFLNEL